MLQNLCAPGSGHHGTGTDLVEKRVQNSGVGHGSDLLSHRVRDERRHAERSWVKPLLGSLIPDDDGKGGSVLEWLRSDRKAEARKRRSASGATSWGREFRVLLGETKLGAQLR